MEGRKEEKKGQKLNEGRRGREGGKNEGEERKMEKKNHTMKNYRNVFFPLFHFHACGICMCVCMSACCGCTRVGVRAHDVCTCLWRPEDDIRTHHP